MNALVFFNLHSQPDVTFTHEKVSCEKLPKDHGNIFLKFPSCQNRIFYRVWHWSWEKTDHQNVVRLANNCPWNGNEEIGQSLKIWLRHCAGYRYCTPIYRPACFSKTGHWMDNGCTASVDGSTVTCTCSQSPDQLCITAVKGGRG